jgi:hypothetical protein
MTLRGNRSTYSEIVLSSATLFTTNLIWSGPGSNRIPAVGGRRLTPFIRLAFIEIYITEFIPHRKHPVPVVMNSGLMFSEIIG